MRKTTKNITRRVGWVLSTAVSVSLAGSAMGQHRVGSDGRALDANNRIGSGGVNEQGNRGPASALGNQIVTGQVTGGQQFRGFVPYSDPFVFRGPTAGLNSDRFIRESAGVPIPGITNNNNASVVRPFYGESQVAAPPPGFAQQSPGTGFIPAPLISREAGDLRLGRPIEQPQITLPQPGQLVLPGPVDPSTQQPSVITASPLYGVRQWNFEEQDDQAFLRGLNEVGSRTRLDDRTLRQMREELLNSELQPDGEQAPADGTQRPRTDGDRLDDRPLTPLESPQNRPISQGARLDDQLGSDPLGGSVATNQRSQLRMIGPPERQSSQYAEMRRRLERYNRLPESMSDLEQHQRFAQQQRAQRERDQQAGAGTQQQQGGQPQPGQQPAQQPGQQPGQQPSADATRRGDAPPTLPDSGLPDFDRRRREINEPRTPDAAAAQPGQPDPTGQASRDATAGATREPPLRIESLATGVQAKGLADMLKEAESLMKQGKFYSALDQYELAEQVAPNQPMVAMGRAIAELGASYYGRADTHLREAFTKDPALLMAQYDLESLLGRERLEFLVQDLRAISKTEAKEPRSVFLLAFIDYNTGNPRRAAAYLDLAEKRAGQSDPLFASLRKHWNLPAADAGATQDANK